MISIVLDEDLDVRLRLHFGPGVRAETVAYRGWRHLTNGALLRAMAAAGDVDVFVTADTNLRHQQPVADLPFGVLVLRPRRAVLARLLELMPDALRVLPSVRPGTVVEVHPPPAEGSGRG